jgi:hypothetical protein
MIIWILLGILLYLVAGFYATKWFILTVEQVEEYDIKGAQIFIFAWIVCIWPIMAAIGLCHLIGRRWQAKRGAWFTIRRKKR